MDVLHDEVGNAVEDMYKFFKSYDVDKDGNLDASELKKLLDQTKHGKKFKDPRDGVYHCDHFKSSLFKCYIIEDHT